MFGYAPTEHYCADVMLQLSIMVNRPWGLAVEPLCYRQTQSRGRSLSEHLAAKAYEARRAAAGFRRHGSGFLDQTLSLDQAAKVLFVQPNTGQAFDRRLQLEQREIVRHY